MIWTYSYQDNKPTWKQATSYIDTIMAQISQEIQLWVTENPMNILSGVNYKQVFALEVFIRNEINTILQRYQDQLDYYQVLNVSTKDNVLTIDIDISIQAQPQQLSLQLNQGS